MNMNFESGQTVRLITQPNRVGSIIERLQPVGEIDKYRVFYSTGDIQDYLQGQLTSAAQPLTSTELAAARQEGDVSSASLW